MCPKVKNSVFFMRDFIVMVLLFVHVKRVIVSRTWDFSGSVLKLNELFFNRFVNLGADMEKDNLLTPARFQQKLFYPRKCVNCDKNELTTKQ